MALTRTSFNFDETLPVLGIVRDGDLYIVVFKNKNGKYETVALPHSWEDDDKTKIFEKEIEKQIKLKI